MRIKFKRIRLEELLFGAFILFVFFLPFTKISIPVIAKYELTIADVILCFLFVVNVLFFRDIKKLFRPYIYIFLLFVFCVLASGVMVQSFRLFFLGVLPYAFATLILISTLSFFSRGSHLDQFRSIFNTLFISLFLCTLPVYYQLLSGMKPVLFYDLYGWRYTFLAQNPNQFGVYIILYFFILSLLSLKYFENKLFKTFLLMLIFFPVALFSGSKTATFIFSVNFLFVAFILFLKTPTAKKIVVTPIVVILLGISIPLALEFTKSKGGQINRALSIFELVASKGEILDSKSATGRSLTEGVALYLKFPILGVGMANKPMHSSVTTEIHNTYIKFLAETGTIGFISFLLIFLFPLISMWFSRSSLLVKLTFTGFYAMFIAMNWPHMLLRQRWVWFFMIICFIIARVGKDGKLERSNLSLLN